MNVIQIKNNHHTKYFAWLFKWRLILLFFSILFWKFIRRFNRPSHINRLQNTQQTKYYKSVEKIGVSLNIYIIPPIRKLLSISKNCIINIPTDKNSKDNSFDFLSSKSIILSKIQSNALQALLRTSRVIFSFLLNLLIVYVLTPAGSSNSFFFILLSKRICTFL